MALFDILKKGIDYTNKDETAQGMMADFKDHKVGVKFDDCDITLVVKDGLISFEKGVREDCDACLRLQTADLCGAIDNSFDLLEIREKGELVKGDIKDPNLPVHLMAIFPFFDAMVRLYEEEADFRGDVDAVKAAL